MARTVVGLNDAKAVKLYKGLLAIDVSHKGYWASRFAARGEQAEVPVQILTDLETDAGEQITYDLLVELRMQPVEGDDILEGREEAQKFYTDAIYIDQARCGVNTGGRMTRKRTINRLRDLARRQQSGWWARVHDELAFIYGSGTPGTVTTHKIFGSDYTGRANNTLVTPDSNHRFYGGDATAFNNIDSADTMTMALLNAMVTRAAVQGGGASGVPVLQPCKIDGNEHYVCVMHPYQENALRTSTATSGEWLDMQKAAATAEGRNSPLFKGGLGMVRGAILHSHRNAVRFNTAGSGANVSAARGLFLGAQAMVMAYGSPGTGMRFEWHEEARDNNNQVVISTSSIFGVKKVSFTTDEAGAQDFGVFAFDTAVTVV